jgi:hypothetical protein
LNVLKGRAKFDSPEEKVHTRLAGLDNRVYLDLCNDKWEVVEISPQGWKVVKESPVHLIRSNGMKALPTPVPGVR